MNTLTSIKIRLIFLIWPDHYKQVRNYFLMSLLAMFLWTCNEPGKTEDKTSLEHKVVLELKPSAENPRNSEGDFIQLKNGDILFVYSHFISGDGDYASAKLNGRLSKDGGLTWSAEDLEILDNEGGLNTMSVSMLRLQNGDIAIFYARKNSHKDCRPVMRISNDEAKTWSEAIECIREDTGYYVLNNDRVIQLKSGRLIMPVSLHEAPGMPWSDGGQISVYYSDDVGMTWQESDTVANPHHETLQEPGVVELSGGRLMLFTRNNSGFQHVSFSEDQGLTWSPSEPGNIPSPRSPASIERIPKTGDLIMAWNNNGGDDPSIRGKRTPFNVAISKDEGRSWQRSFTLADNVYGWYCYTAIDFIDDQILLGHCAGDRRENNGLAESHITRFSVDHLYR